MKEDYSKKEKLIREHLLQAGRDLERGKRNVHWHPNPSINDMELAKDEIIAAIRISKTLFKDHKEKL